MIRILSKIFIRERQQTDDPEVRRAWGALCGAVGILLNLLLFGVKALAGALTGSIAVTADAFNNLSDSLSSAVTLIGFRLSARKPDRDHPYGHRRYEDIAGLIVSLAILLMGLDLAVSSAKRIFAPEPVNHSALSLAILLGSILVKLYMALFNRSVGRRIQSSVLSATAADSFSDAIATSAVLVSALVSRFTNINIDAWAGAAVSLLVVWAGLRAARDAVNPLLGRAPDPAFVHRVEKIVLDSPAITGMHDLMVHDYGAGRVMLSLHAEVRADSDLLSLHEAIDQVERRLQSELNCSATIHFDPIEPADGAAKNLRQRIEARIREEIGGGIALHDFRYAPGAHIAFDAVIPYELPIEDADAQAVILHILEELCPDCSAEIVIDHPVSAEG